MTTVDQHRKAQTLLQLHQGHRILALPNIWNPIGAGVLASKGYPAVATARQGPRSTRRFVRNGILYETYSFDLGFYRIPMP